MPKIPTFEARGRPTAEATGVTTGIQVSPTATPAAGLLPQLNTLTNYALKKRDVAEKVQANKKVFEIKGELDKFLKAEEENIDDENAINNFKGKYNDYVKQQLSLVENNRIKKRIQQNLDLEYSEYVYNIKKNSYAALEKNALEDVNNNITSYTSKYSTTQDVKLKSKYRNEAQNKIKQFAEDFDLPQNVLEQKLEALDKDFLLADIQQFAGSPNGVEAIKLADDSYGGENTLDNVQFGTGVYNSYLGAISRITVKGDPNSDYEEALDLVDELRSFERNNGYKVNTGSLTVKIDDLEQKILTEKITHDKNMRTLTINKELNEFTKDLEGDIQKSVAGSALDPFESEATEIAATKAVDEFKTKMKIYVATYPDATLQEKKAYATSQAFVIANKYDDMNIQKLSDFDVSAEDDNVTKYNNIVSDMQLLSEGKLSEDKIKEYEELATANGYQGDINLFMNDYLPLLASQLEIGG